jgi:hypothetical protein
MKIPTHPRALLKENDVNWFFLEGQPRGFPVRARMTDKSVFLSFPFSDALRLELKAMEGCGFNWDTKEWKISATRRNCFQLMYLLGMNPYERYDKTPPEIIFERKLLEKQKRMVEAGVYYHRQIIAAEMGTGKTLAAIEIMERSGTTNWWWVGPKAASFQASIEFRKWKSRVHPRMFTYGKLVSHLQNLKPGSKPPEGIIFDEVSALKSHTAKRTVAALHLTDAMRAEYEDPFIIGLSGTPAPKAPTDWWALAEVTEPGFLKEGNPQVLTRRLAILEKYENQSGAAYHKIVDWRDSESKCHQCGKEPEHIYHTPLSEKFHVYQPCANEVAYLGKRLKGLVMTVLKKDCIDLPEKRYQAWIIPQSEEFKQLEQHIVNTSMTAVSALTLVRQLSDGFQYRDKPTGRDIVCPECKGSLKVQVEAILDEAGNIDYDYEPKDGEEIVYQKIEIPCDTCAQTGKVTEYERETLYIGSPKEQALMTIMDLHEEVGRLVVFAAFQGSIDTIQSIATKKGWKYICVDGRGWRSDIGEHLDPVQLLEMFQSNSDEKILFIGHPGSAGMGITLTASPTSVFYSNPYTTGERVQAEDRIHRIGMRLNLGATIIDLVHLQSDLHVIRSLRKKKDLMRMSLGLLKEAVASKGPVYIDDKTEIINYSLESNGSED